MLTLEVGKRYNPAVPSWPEAVQYNWRGGAHELVLFWHAPTGAEVWGVRRDPLDLALVVEQDQILLLYRFRPSLPWSDAPYSWHLVPEGQRTIPESLPSGEGRALLTTVLVSAEDGIVRAIRVVSLAPSFTATLHLAIRDQAARPWPGDAEYDRQLADLYQRYPTAEALLEIARARTTGGR